MKQFFNRNPRHRERQKGALTMFSAVLILILLTEMIFYAVQVGVFEQRKSSNEMNQNRGLRTTEVQ
jgi:Tfp pilus assembly protein PilX